jgi:hypothetical protein
MNMKLNQVLALVLIVVASKFSGKNTSDVSWDRS